MNSATCVPGVKRNGGEASAGVASVDYAEGGKSLRPYITMELVDGVDLLAGLGGYPLTINEKTLRVAEVSRSCRFIIARCLHA